MKTCVSTYSYGSYNHSDKLGIYGIIDKTAELGFAGIEFCEGEWIDNLDIDKAKRVREHAEKAGLDIVSYCAGADFINGSNGNIKDEITKLKLSVDFAAALGVKNMRHDCTSGFRGRQYSIGVDDALLIVAEGCREVTMYAEQKGIGTMTENHGYFLQGSFRHEKLINAVAHKNFGALVDIGNYLCADEDPPYAVGVIAPYVKHAHAKDFHVKSGMESDPGAGWFMSRSGNYLRGAIIGHGDAKVAQSIKALKRGGYDGYLSIEFEGIEDNILGITLGLENLKKYI